MPTKKQLRADIQALRNEVFIREQEIELMTADRDMLQAQLNTARALLAKAQGASAAEAMAIVRGES